MHHKIGSIRASVRGGRWAERIRIPLDQVTRYGKVVVGEVIKVDEEQKLIYFQNPDTVPLKYDILVAASGAQNHSPGDLPSHLRDSASIQKYFDETADAFDKAKDILIVGGGASAVE